VNVLVGYESRGGRTRRAAEAIADALRTEGHDAKVRPLSEIGPEEVEGVDALFVGAWVEGFILFGVGPARGARLWLDRLPSLGGTPAGVFCTYAFHPRGTLGELRRGLEGRGAKVVAERAFHRRRPAEGAGALVREFLARATS